MYVKPCLFLFLILFVSSISLMPSVSFEQMQDHVNMDNSPEKMISKFLEGEDTSKFETTSSGTKPISQFGDLYNVAKNNLLVKYGTEVTIDGETPAKFSTILVEGTMRVTGVSSSTLNVQKIIVGPTGRLIIGSNGDPIDKKVEIVFIKNKPGEIGIFNFGELDIVGTNVSPTFVQLVSDAKPNESVLRLSHIVNSWKKGDKIVITTPGYRYEDPCSIEESEISSINGVTIGLKNPLKCFHSGSSITGDEYAQYSHVSLLSRNIVFKSQDTDNRGSVNFFYNSTGTIKYAEFLDLGQKDTLGRYPIHFHRMEDTSRGIQVVGNSIVNSNNRWITIHDSNGIVVKDNVGYKSVGHGFFLEDGTEFDNVFDNNIGIYTSKGNLINSDTISAIFWNQNPHNIFRSNVSVSGFYYGYYFPIPNKLVKIPETGNSVNLRSLSLLEFDKNQAYNNRHVGLNISINRDNISNFNLGSHIISNFIVLDESNNLDEPFGGIRITGNNISIINTKIYNSYVGIIINGDNNTVSKTKIEYHTDSKNRISLSGVVIGGKENTIQDTEIKGYISKNNDLVSDISLSASSLNQITALINNTKLFDTRPILFGMVQNIDSFLEVHNYRDFNGGAVKYPQNFLLKRIDYDDAKKTGQSNTINLNSFSMMALLNTDALQTKKIITPKQKSDLIYKSDLSIPKWIKNDAKSRCNTKMENNDDLNKFIRYLIDSDLISSSEIHDYGYAQKIPSLVKNNICLWSSNKISDSELINSVQYLVDNGIFQPS